MAHEIQVARIMFLIATRPNQRHKPVEGDLPGDHTFWFDGGAVKYGPEDIRYAFADGSTATVPHHDGASTKILLPDGTPITIGTGDAVEPPPPARRMELEPVRASFGPFAEAFDYVDGATGYGVILDGGDPDAVEVVVRRVAAAMEQGDAPRWVARLLGDDNWRPHLIACVAYLLDAERKWGSLPLWNRIDRGSWVAPQLVGTALLRDPGFALRALPRLARGCPTRDLGDPDAAPSSNSKTLASILGVAPLSPVLRDVERATWTRWWAEPSCALELDLDAERDRSERIALDWVWGMQRAFDRLGIQLTVAETRGRAPRIRHAVARAASSLLAIGAPRTTPAAIEANTKARADRHRALDTTYFHGSVLARRRVWLLREADLPVRRPAAGGMAQLYWAHRNDAERMIVRAPGFGACSAYSIDFERFVSEHLPHLAEAGVRVGVNWSDVDGAGFAYPPRWITECLEREARLGGNTDIEVMPEGLTFGIGEGTSADAPVLLGGRDAGVHAFVAIMKWLEKRYGKEFVQWRLDSATPTTEADRTLNLVTVELPDGRRPTHWFAVSAASETVLAPGTRTFAHQLSGFACDECGVAGCWSPDRMKSTGWAEWQGAAGGRWLLECRCRAHGLTLGQPVARREVDALLTDMGLLPRASSAAGPLRSALL